MPYPAIYIDTYRNETGQPQILRDLWKVLPGSKIFRSTISGPLYLNERCQFGPDVTAGKYVGCNESCFIARAQLGSYLALGARVAINPFNHPTDWLSTQEFQYRDDSYNWVPEFRDMKRLTRNPDMFEPVVIGSDVWMGHNAMVMPGVTVGDGAVIAAGSVVTKDVPPFAIVAGMPATVKKYRFPERTIERLLAVRWWDFEITQLSGLNFRDVEASLDRLEQLRAESAD